MAHNELAFDNQAVIGSLKKVLNNCGYDIPEVISPEEVGQKPRQWIIRGTGADTLLSVNGLGQLIPCSGQMGSFGVFFADRLTALMLPPGGVYIIFNSRHLSDNWLSIPSGDYRQEMFKIGRERNFDFSKFSGCLDAETAIFKKYPVYQPISGIATWPKPLDLSQAERILVTDEFLSKNEPLSLSAELTSKIVPFSISRTIY